jgi:hypothetical protein
MGTFGLAFELDLGGNLPPKIGNMTGSGARYSILAFHVKVPIRFRTPEHLPWEQQRNHHGGTVQLALSGM